ncbi:MAG: NAD(P)/FAD-dependent oxidoreductase [Myxococcota bacterium]
MPTSSSASRFDAVVIGAGFGGLGAALTLAEGGARVCLLEQLSYPGGCASTFRRRGHRFESGATLFSGFGEGQLFRRWIDRHQLPVTIDFIDPLVELRTPDLTLRVGRDREALVQHLASLPGAPVDGLKAFFRYQKQVADALWPLFDDPALLPPFGARSLLRHLARGPAYLPLASAVGRSLGAVLRRFGVDRFRPLRIYLDALCQITVQCSAEEAEAPFALSTMDYYYRGTGHVRGGIGQLAGALLEATRGLGAEVHLARQVRQLERVGDRWRVHARGGLEVEAPTVVANLLPHNVARLVDARSPRLERRARRVEQGWGAAMLYLVVDPPPGAAPEAHHLELVPDPQQDFIEGHHLFCSIGEAHPTTSAGRGERTLTVSTHVPMAKLRSLDPSEQGIYVQSVQDRMRRGLAQLAPEWWSRVTLDMSGSPRTFERFTGRAHGYVGGIPRRRGLHHYLDLIPGCPFPGLHLVGDSVFPGQSTLATAMGGIKAAERVLGPSRRALAGPREARALPQPSSAGLESSTVNQR